MSNLIEPQSKRGSALLALIRTKYPTYHPVMAMLEIANHEDADLRLQFDCHKTVAKYIEPELKSIEVKGDFAKDDTVKVSLFDMSDVTDVSWVEPSPPEMLPSEAYTSDLTVSSRTYDNGI